MFHLPVDTTLVLLTIVGLIVANVIGVSMQIRKISKEEGGEQNG